MSEETKTQDEMTATQPTDHHAWLSNLLGTWRIESELTMEPGQPPIQITGSSVVKNLGGLWAYAENEEHMPDGSVIQSYIALGYDVTFKEYRGSIVMSASSHLWKYAGRLSEDGKTMTLDCEGPDMTRDEGTAFYREEIQLIDSGHRVQHSYAQDKEGKWQRFATAHYYRT